MSQATVARKERRKRFIAKLKQNYERSLAGELRPDNTQSKPIRPTSGQRDVHPQSHLHEMFLEAFDAAQQIVALTQQAFQDGFLAGCAHGKLECANKIHAAMHTFDKSEMGTQTDSVDTLLFGHDVLTQIVPVQVSKKCFKNS